MTTAAIEQEEQQRNDAQHDHNRNHNAGNRAAIQADYGSRISVNTRASERQEKQRKQTTQPTQREHAWRDAVYERVEGERVREAAAYAREHFSNHHVGRCDAHRRIDALRNVPCEHKDRLHADATTHSTRYLEAFGHYVVSSHADLLVGKHLGRRWHEADLRGSLKDLRARVQKSSQKSSTRSSQAHPQRVQLTKYEPA